MMKLFNFPDDRTEEAEAEDRPSRAPPSHEREPAAARVSGGRQGPQRPFSSPSHCPSGRVRPATAPRHGGFSSAQHTCKYWVLYSVYGVATPEVWVYVL